MTAPSKHLERTRGRVLSESEQLRVASRVHLVTGAEYLKTRIRGRIYLALTDRRLLVVTDTVRAVNARVLTEWPAGTVTISVTRRKLGGNLIHIHPVVSSGAAARETLSFEWITGHRPRDWANCRFRR